MKHLASPFRGFFLGAAILAATTVLGWMRGFSGHTVIVHELGPSAWHAHEMLFGYTGAVLAGFLLTAAKQWTGHKTVGPWGLGVLVALWGAARMHHQFDVPMPFVGAIELLFFLGVAAAIGRPIVVSKKWRNLPFALMMVLLGVSDRLMHAGVVGDLDSVWLHRGLWLAMDSVSCIILVFGGRIVPLFTKNALSLPQVRPKGMLDYGGLAMLGGLMIAHALGANAEIEATVWLVAGCLTLARLYGWGGSKSLKNPLVLVLHLGWLCMGLGMLVIAYSLATNGLLFTSALHLLAVGGFGILTLGMMARVTLGHTGRPLAASPIATAAFFTMTLAAIVRVVAGAFTPQTYIQLLWVAAGAWSLSFLLFLSAYGVALFSPRRDGKPG